MAQIDLAKYSGTGLWSTVCGWPQLQLAASTKVQHSNALGRPIAVVNLSLLIFNSKKWKNSPISKGETLPRINEHLMALTLPAAA